MNFVKTRNLECVSRGEKGNIKNITRTHESIYVLINVYSSPLCVYTKSTYYLLLKKCENVERLACEPISIPSI